jgi:Methyltransferase domain
MKASVYHHPTYRNRLFLVLATIHVNGLKAAATHYSQRFIHALSDEHGKPAKTESGTDDGRFTVASNDEQLEYLAIQSSNVKWGLPYGTWSQEIFDKAMQSVSIPPADYGFIDLGAGKGNSLLLASRYPFRTITGVEYSKTLTDAACANISAQQASGVPIQCICGDAAEFEFPNEPTVLLLNNPFQGKVMDRVIANIEKSLRANPRDLWVIYGNPWEGRKFRRSVMFKTIEWNLDFSIHRSFFR